ncbi:MAG: hypothetical protein JKY89_11060 [Immundisolibacteraceae bacterium]|nr:hypothetical protein [Immundisolibacteraceae bacterium]
MNKKLAHLLLALIPLLLTPLLSFVLFEGLLNLGGGEKDIIWAIVWAVWSLTFAISALVLIWRNWALKRWVWRSAMVATGGMLMLSVLVFGV